MTVKKVGDGSHIAAGPDSINEASSVTEPVYRGRVTGDAYDRVQITGAGVATGDGTATPVIGTFMASTQAVPVSGSTQWKVTTDDHASFSFNFSNDSVFNGTKDPVVDLGYNMGLHGGAVDAGFNGIGLQFEGDYNIDGVNHYSEAHLVARLASGAATRIWTAQQHLTTGVCDISFDVHKFAILDTASAVEWVNFTSTGGTSNIVDLKAGSAQSGPVVRIKDAPGSATLFTIDSSGNVAAGSYADNGSSIISLKIGTTEKARIDANGCLGINTSPTTGQVEIVPRNASTAGIKMTLASAASADAIDIFAFGGAGLFSVGTDGSVVSAGSHYLRLATAQIAMGAADDVILKRNTAGVLQTLTSFMFGSSGNGFAGLYGQVSNNGDINTRLRQKTGQTADMVLIEAVDQTVWHRFNKNGYDITKKNAAPADAELSAGECARWFDATNGAAKAMFKGKTLDGTVVTATVVMS